MKDMVNIVREVCGTLGGLVEKDGRTPEKFIVELTKDNRKEQ